MTLGELLNYLDEHTKYDFVVEGGTLEAAKTNTHPNALVGELVRHIAEKCNCHDEDSEVKREQVVNAIGPIRLKYMADDAPVEGFRLIEGSVIAIDAAFNDEALRQRNG